MADPIDLTSIRRIVVLRANGLGDFLFATPALRALAKGLPDARITYLCQPWLRSFIDGRYPYVHDVRLVPPYPGIRAIPADGNWKRSAAAFFRRMRAEKFDLAIQLHGGGGQSNPFIRQLGARRTIGLAARDAPDLDLSLRYIFYQPEVARYVEVVALLGLPGDGYTMDAPEVAADVTGLRAGWPDAFSSPYAVVHVGASDPRRRWPIARFGAIADHLCRRYGLTVVATGSIEDAPLIRQLASTANVPVVDLAGRLDLGAVLALVRRARITVSNDTGIGHFAVATRCPSVIVYWCGNVITAGAFERGHHRPMLSWTVQCPACGQRSCRCQVSFVQDVNLDEVLTEVDDLLLEGSGRNERSQTGTMWSKERSA